MNDPDPIQALRILVTGRVQGVGFRPFVSRIANEFKLAGWVQNLGGRVVSALSSKVDYLVVGENPGSKLTKAQQLGIKILNQKDFEEMAHG